MMMKRTILIFLAFIVALPAFSQVKFGLKAGVSTTNLKMSDLKTLVSGDKSFTVEALKTAKYGFHAGAFVRVSLAGFYLQPELLFASRTDVYQVTDLSNPLQSIEQKQQFNRLDLPVMLVVHLGPLIINAGPSARLLINSPKDLITNPDFKTMYNNLTFGYQAGIGVDFLKRITVDLRYEGSLSRYQTKVEEAGGSTIKLDDRPNAFLLSVGIVF
jgi:hypothetical protein